MRVEARMDHGPIDPEEETSTCPRRMSASDGNCYVVKMRNGGPKSNFNEYVASGIAKIFRLPTAEPTVVHLGADFVRRMPALQGAQIEPGPYLATRYVRGAYDVGRNARFSAQPEQVTNLEDVPSFVVFDILVNNKDRNDGNTLLAPSRDDEGHLVGYRYMLIDHGHCFGGPSWDSDTVSDLPYELAHVPWRTDGVGGEGDFCDPAECMAGLSGKNVDKAREGLPDKWDVPAGEYEALRDAVTSRSAGRMLDAIRVNQGLFAGWRDE